MLADGARLMLWVFREDLAAPRTKRISTPFPAVATVQEGRTAEAGVSG